MARSRTKPPAPTVRPRSRGRAAEGGGAPPQAASSEGTALVGEILFVWLGSELWDTGDPVDGKDLAVANLKFVQVCVMFGPGGSCEISTSTEWATYAADQSSAV